MMKIPFQKNYNYFNLKAIKRNIRLMGFIKET